MPINPTWTEEEIILAYDLFLRHERRDLGRKNPDIVALSDFLRCLPWHVGKWQDENFRNTGAVINKISQLRAYEADENPYSVSNVVRGVALKYRHTPHKVHALADAIRENVAAQLEILSEDIPAQTGGEETTYREGQIRFARHKRLERSRALVNSKLASVKAQTGKLACEVCGFDFEEAFGELGRGFAECHHLTPLANLGESETKLRDLAVVCPNCHRMLHRRNREGRLLAVDDLRVLRRDLGGPS